MNWDAGTIWFRNGDGRQQAARCESALSGPALGALACLTHVAGPRVDMQLARLSRELPRLLCVPPTASSQCGRPGSHWHGGRRSLIARLQSARYPRCRLAPPPFPFWVFRHSAPSSSTHVLGYPLEQGSQRQRWKPRIGGTRQLRVGAFRTGHELRNARLEPGYLAWHAQRSSPTH